MSSLLIRLGIVSVASAIQITSLAHAFPVVDAVAGLPHPALVTVYPDEADANLYYFVPTSVALVRDENGKPRLGVQYWGLTDLDPAGVGAALTLSVQPAYDKAKVDEVATAIKAKNPNAKFAFPTLVDSSMEILINGAYNSGKQDTTKPTMKGGTVDAAQAFTMTLTDIGGRAFAQGVAPNSDILGARYTYKFTGVAKRLKAEITVYHKRVFEHFRASATSSSWWGLVKTSWGADWTKLTNDGSIKLKILEGGESNNEEYMLEVFKILVDAKINEKGIFAPKLQPAGVSGAPEASKWGWGFNAGAGWEKLDESVNLVFTIDKQKLEDREFTAGLTFSAVCATYPDSFVDLTTGGKCLDLTKITKTASARQKCLDAKVEALAKLHEKKAIPDAIWEAEVKKAYDTTPNCVP